MIIKIRIQEQQNACQMSRKDPESSRYAGFMDRHLHLVKKHAKTHHIINAYYKMIGDVRPNTLDTST